MDMRAPLSITAGRSAMHQCRKYFAPVLWHFVLRGAGERVKLNINACFHRPRAIIKLRVECARLTSTQTHPAASHLHVHDTGVWIFERAAMKPSLRLRHHYVMKLKHGRRRIGLHTLPESSGVIIYAGECARKEKARCVCSAVE